MRHVSSQQGGVQEVRAKIGNAVCGARVVYGEPVFVTISPIRRLSGLVMRRSRVRGNDPLLGHEDMPLEDAQNIGSSSSPTLQEEGDILIDLYDYEARKS